MQEIVDRHHVEGSRYLLPILSEERGDIRRQYLNALHRMNVQLKRLATRKLPHSADDLHGEALLGQCCLSAEHTHPVNQPGIGA